MRPDQCAKLAEIASRGNRPKDAFFWTAESIRARAMWVMINGKWCNRRNVMKP